jgi:hypothetical protein
LPEWSINTREPLLTIRSGAFCQSSLNTIEYSGWLGGTAAYSYCGKSLRASSVTYVSNSGPAPSACVKIKPPASA